MVAISFSVLKDKILNGEKRQTIRLLGKKWGNVYLDFNLKNKPIKLQLYWHQRSKEGYKLKDVILKKISIIYLIDITEEIAMADGFKSLKECKEWFRETYPNIALDIQQLVLIKW